MMMMMDMVSTLPKWSSWEEGEGQREGEQWSQVDEPESYIKLIMTLGLVVIRTTNLNFTFDQFWLRPGKNLFTRIVFFLVERHCVLWTCQTKGGVPKKWKFKMTFAISRCPPPPLMAHISRIFLPHFFSFVIESYIQEMDFTLQTLPKALRTQALTALTSNFGLVGLVQYAR